jgi:hypothetical protein
MHLYNMFTICTHEDCICFGELILSTLLVMQVSCLRLLQPKEARRAPVYVRRLSQQAWYYTWGREEILVGGVL